MEREPIDSKYLWSILTVYQYWTLMLNDSPGPHLGQALVWLARPGKMQRYTSLNDAEAAELWEIMRRYEAVLERLWKPDHMNYLWLGNYFHEHGGHGHMHLVPRYKEPRTFGGMTFVDTKYGAMHTPVEKVQYSQAQLLAMRQTIAEAMCH